MLILAAICLALARPKLFSEGAVHIGQDRSVAVVLLFDTSYSMEYTIAGKTRLDEAKRRAQELLDELPAGSRVAVFDSAETGGEWQPSLQLVRERVAGLRLRHANAPLTRQLDQVYRLLGKLDTEPSEGEEALPKLLYVFSDRTQECWDAETARSLKQPPGVNAVFVDVGVENPADVAVVNLELPLDTDRDQPRQVFGTRDRLTLRATVRAIGGDCDTELFCRVDGRKEPLRQHVVVKAGESVVIPFEFDLQDLKAGPHAVAVELATNDALPFDNARYFRPWRPIQVSPISVAHFFSERGLAVLRSEVIWIWIPTGLLTTGVLATRYAFAEAKRRQS